ncbi:WhiB family transcriptional regulator [Nocardioides sp. WG-D5]
MSTAWMADAACTTREVQGLPWTTDTIEVPEVIVDLMRSTCDGCAVRSACNSYALNERVSGGMWAGTDRAPEPEDLLDLIDAIPMTTPTTPTDPMAVAA